ncbi:hypothetical protein BJ165DRAFT_604991 [Panaeolus papilionaceus]|nr:hypothetical protein BJ165DRAFT_604991 [Panaeolus papilionaceus]
MSAAAAAQDIPAIEAIETTPAAKPASTKTSRSTTKKATATTKKPASATKPKAAAAPKPKKATTTKAAPAAANASGRPSWKDIIKECIAINKEDARTGVSRSTIKKFAEEKYKIEMNPLALSQLNRAITSGAESGVFSLPKGPSGKVKLAPKAKASASKENSKPPSKTASKPAATKSTATVKKPAAAATKAPAKKAAAAPKKVLAGKAKATTTTKKTTAASKRGTAKKVSIVCLLFRFKFRLVRLGRRDAVSWG